MVLDSSMSFGPAARPASSCGVLTVTPRTQTIILHNTTTKAIAQHAHPSFRKCTSNTSQARPSAHKGHSYTPHLEKNWNCDASVRPMPRVRRARASPRGAGEAKSPLNTCGAHATSISPSPARSSVWRASWRMRSRSASSSDIRRSLASCRAIVVGDRRCIDATAARRTNSYSSSRAATNVGA